MKKIIFGALLTLGVVTFVGCADKSNEVAEKPAASKCGGEKSSKCGGEKKESKCGAEKSSGAKKCGAENNGKCGTEK